MFNILVALKSEKKAGSAPGENVLSFIQEGPQTLERTHLYQVHTW